MPLASWLFIRNTESIWIERPYGHSIVVAGPGPARAQHDFTDEAALQAYQIETAEVLTENGWFLWVYNGERRGGTDRRTNNRGTDRRRTVAYAS